MATAREHLDWAEQNEAFARSLDRKYQVDINWTITALFYSAVHYVDSYFAARGTRPPDHETREKQIRELLFFTSIRKDYKRLKDMSREARYELAPYGEREVLEAKGHLERIKAVILAKVNQPNPAP